MTIGCYAVMAACNIFNEKPLKIVASGYNTPTGFNVFNLYSSPGDVVILGAFVEAAKSRLKNWERIKPVEQLRTSV